MATMGNMSEFLAESFCRACSGKISKGESRVVIMAVEIQGTDADEPGPIEEYKLAFHIKCAAEVESFENPWKIRSDFLANPPEHPPEEMTLENLSRGTGDLAVDHNVVSLDDALGATLSGDQRGTPPPPNEAERAVAKFRKLPAELREIAFLHSRGKTQQEISELLEIPQRTVSRRILEIKAIRKVPL
jgi:hypothetical protein